MKGEPHSISETRGYATELNKKINLVYSARKALDQAIEDLCVNWAADSASRNRPDRQQLCGELIALFPRPLKFGAVMDKISESVNGKGHS